MPLDIPTNQKELTELADALDRVAARQAGEIPKKRFAYEAKRTRVISRLLDHLNTLDPVGIRILLGHLKTTLRLLQTLTSHTSSKEGQTFWKNKAQILLGLADILESNLSKKTLTPAL